MYSFSGPLSVSLFRSERRKHREATHPMHAIARKSVYRLSTGILIDRGDSPPGRLVGTQELIEPVSVFRVGVSAILSGDGKASLILSIAS